jgi:hypothetical protein
LRTVLPNDPEQCPDVVFSVIYTPAGSVGPVPLGYIPLPLAEVYGFNHAVSWATMLRDPLLPQVSAVPGFVQYRRDVGRKSELPSAARKRISVPPMRKFELRAHLYQAESLPSMDEDGLCNPYVVVTLDGYAGHTRVVAPMCNPTWYQTERVEVMLPQPTPITSTVRLSVFDKEPAGTEGGDALVGIASIPLLKVEKRMAAAPSWYQLTLKDGRGNAAAARGRLLASCQLIPLEEVGKMPLNDITPQSRNCDIEVFYRPKIVAVYSTLLTTRCQVLTIATAFKMNP